MSERPTNEALEELANSNPVPPCAEAANETLAWRSLIQGGPCATCQQRGYLEYIDPEEGLVQYPCPVCSGTQIAPDMITRLEAVSLDLPPVSPGQWGPKAAQDAIVAEFRSLIETT